MRETREEDLEIADHWAGEECSLNGWPATVTGRMCKFAVIRTNDFGIEFSWPAVDRIMQTGGFFHCYSPQSIGRIRIAARNNIKERE